MGHGEYRKRKREIKRLIHGISGVRRLYRQRDVVESQADLPHSLVASLVEQLRVREYGTNNE